MPVYYGMRESAPILCANYLLYESKTIIHTAHPIFTTFFVFFIFGSNIRASFTHNLRHPMRLSLPVMFTDMKCFIKRLRLRPAYLSFHSVAIVMRAVTC